MDQGTEGWEKALSDSGEMTSGPEALRSDSNLNGPEDLQRNGQRIAARREAMEGGRASKPWSSGGIPGKEPVDSPEKQLYWQGWATQGQRRHTDVKGALEVVHVLAVMGNNNDLGGTRRTVSLSPRKSKKLEWG
uniref:Uncharacterized protein n=1 Tax=Sphaerodactylus townsendi TaxID=933632 RepID=A0ACB8GBV6_9SAUR